MQDRFRFRVWFTPDYQEPEMIYDAEQTYDNRCRNEGSYYHDNFGEILEDKNCIVMQCTGLKDKNCKLIYEGDIVKFAFHELAEEKAWEKAVIVWGDKYKYPAFDIDKCEFECNGLSYIFNEDWVIEVIGNIYENPELLED